MEKETVKAKNLPVKMEMVPHIIMHAGRYSDGLPM